MHGPGEDEMNGGQDVAGSATGEWRRHWPLVLASSVGFSFFSIMLAASGLFMGPLGKEFHWSRTTLSAGPSVAVFATALLATPFGWLIDRLGSRMLVMVGTVLTMASIAAFSLANGSTTQWLGLWLVFGVVAVSIKSTAWTAAVVGVFTGSRGFALGLTLAGTAVAAMIVPPLANWLIEHQGWRMAYVWLGLGWGSVTLVLSWLFFYDARDRNAKALREGRAPETMTEGGDLPGLTPREALRDSALWRLALSNFTVMVLTQGLQIHLFQILVESGSSRAQAAGLASLAGLAGIIGKLVTGTLLDRVRQNWVGGLTLAAAAAAFALLIQGIASPVAIVIALLVNGYAGGSKTQITGFLTASYGGMRYFGTIYGVMSALMALASGVGPLLAGMSYDHFGNYTAFLIAGAVGCALSGLLMLSMPAYPSWMKREEARVFS